MLRTCLVIACVSVLSGTLSAQTQPSTTLNATEKIGRKIFQTRCAMCHVGQEPAVEMAGNAGAAPRQTTLGPLLSKTQAVNEDKLRAKIKNGGPRMPGYSLALNDEQINQVIAFLKTVDSPITKLAIARAGE